MHFDDSVKCSKIENLIPFHPFIELDHIGSRQIELLVGESIEESDIPNNDYKIGRYTLNRNEFF